LIAADFTMIETIRQDLRYAVRSFRRAPLAALTIVVTVALGLGVVAVVFTVYDIFLLRSDAVRSPGELYAVELERWTGPGDADEDLPFTRRDYDALRRETDVFTDAFAMVGSARVTRVEGRPARPVFVSGNFFQVLGGQAALGRPLLPGDDERFAGQPVIVLSHAGWRKLFRSDPSVIGRRVTINGAPYEIVGVMPDGFRGLGVTPPDYWAPLALAGQFSAGPEDAIVIEVVGRLKPKGSPEAAASALSIWASGRTEFKPPPGRPIQASLTPRQGTLSGETVFLHLAFSPLFFAFGLILMIGCANVANLLLARGVSRQREIGIRLSLGASRRRIVRQLLTESLLLALAAAAGGLVLSQLFLEGALDAAMTTMPPDFAEFVSLMNFDPPGPDWRLAVFLVAGAIVSTMFFGLAPALQATRLDLVPTMRGEITTGARPRRARHALIALQVGVSALLLISAAVFLRGAFAVSTADPGIRTSDTVRISVATEPRRGAILQALAGDPLVSLVAASSRPTRGVLETFESRSRVPVGQLAVSADYFDVLGFDVVSGRGFLPAERTAEAGVVIVSETIARQLWPAGNGVGQVVRLEGSPPTTDARGAKVEPSRTLTVVGVVRDPGREAGFSYLATFRGVYLPAGPETPEAWLFLRVRGNSEQARLALVERLMRIDPALGQAITLQGLAGMQTYLLQMGFWITVVLGAMALVLTVSGLFSVLSYVVEQQAKEIGVRMALGAATKQIAALVLTQSLRPVGIGLLVGTALAAALATVLMMTGGGAELTGWVPVFDPVAYSASLLLIVTSCVLAVSVPTLRAARIDPIATLRKD
jgi:predicted permease